MSRTLGPKSQPDMLLQHFKSRDNISQLEAGALHRIRSLSRRINDLEARGYQFRRDVRRDSTGQRYTRYYFMGKAA